MTDQLDETTATRNNLFPDIAKRVPDGMVWKYEVSYRGGYENHTWALVGPRGGIHVNAWEANSRWLSELWSGGIEGHSPTPREYDNPDSPSHAHCWLIGAPCWHDGSSLQFSENIAPYLSPPGKPFTQSDHDMVFSAMLSRYRLWLPESAPLNVGDGNASETPE